LATWLAFHVEELMKNRSVVWHSLLELLENLFIFQEFSSLIIGTLRE